MNIFMHEIYILHMWIIRGNDGKFNALNARTGTFWKKAIMNFKTSFFFLQLV